MFINRPDTDAVSEYYQMNLSISKRHYGSSACCLHKASPQYTIGSIRGATLELHGLWLSLAGRES